LAESNSSCRDATLCATKIAAQRRALGRRISHADAQIAAIAQVRGAKLATRNIADFEDCGLDVVDPLERAVNSWLEEVKTRGLTKSKPQVSVILRPAPLQAFRP